MLTALRPAEFSKRFTLFLRRKRRRIGKFIFNRKVNYKIKSYLECPVHFDGADKMIEYIDQNRGLLGGGHRVTSTGIITLQSDDRRRPETLCH